MGVERFVVTLQPAGQGKQEERHWHKDEVMRSMAWLKRMNARGYNVLIRPDGAHGLVLLDGLSKAQLRTLRERGFGPAVVLDVDRERHQAWVKLCDGAIPEVVQELAARGLRKELGLPDFGVAGARDGKLAGLTYRAVRAQHEDNPYVLVVESADRVAAAGQDYLQRIQMELTKARWQQPSRHEYSRGLTR